MYCSMEEILGIDITEEELMQVSSIRDFVICVYNASEV
jgi:hypothetical protein